jgi:DNA polymerase III alpha subunit
VNASEADFSLEDGHIRYALGAIRNVGYAAMEHVAEVRKAGAGLTRTCLISPSGWIRVR